MSTLIRLDEALWSDSMSPKAILERWFQAEDAWVTAGQTVAEVSIEGARHDIVAPIAGRLSRFEPVATVLDPGASVGAISPALF